MLAWYTFLLVSFALVGLVCLGILMFGLSPSRTIYELVSHVKGVYPPVHVATTEPINLENPPASIDGRNWLVGWYVLVQFQVEPTENGIYYVQGIHHWVRCPYLQLAAQAIEGNRVYVYYGEQYGGMTRVLKFESSPPDAHGFPAIGFTSYALHLLDTRGYAHGKWCVFEQERKVMKWIDPPTSSKVQFRIGSDPHEAGYFVWSAPEHHTDKVSHYTLIITTLPDAQGSYTGMVLPFVWHEGQFTFSKTISNEKNELPWQVFTQDHELHIHTSEAVQCVVK